MTPEQKQKLVDQAQQIADDGCLTMPIDCDDCFLQKPCDAGGCPRSTAGGFLFGIAFEKGEL